MRSCGRGGAGTAAHASRGPKDSSRGRPRGGAKARRYLARSRERSRERGRPLVLALSTATIPSEIAAALARHGLEARRIAELAPPDPAKRGRAAYRVELAGGRVIKARRLESAEAARALHALASRLEPAFAPALGCAGPVLLEEWIPGAPLADRDPEPWLETAAGLLARLHATSLDVTPDRVETRRWHEAAAGDLARLAEAALLPLAERLRLEAILDATDPGSAPLVLAHRDFCAGNMVIDAAGTLRVIDNEWLGPHPAGFDLARTACCWPMPVPAWRRFLAAYRAAGPDPGPLTFWEIAAYAWTVRVRLRRSREHAATALARLRGVAAPTAAPPSA